MSAFQEFGDVADPDPYATNEYLVKQLNGLNLAYLHMVEPRANGATDSTGEFQHQSLAPFRKLFNGPFLAAGIALSSMNFEDWMLAMQRACKNMHDCCASLHLYT